MQSIFNCPLASRQLPEKEIKKKPAISKNAYQPGSDAWPHARILRSGILGNCPNRVIFSDKSSADSRE